MDSCPEVVAVFIVHPQVLFNLLRSLLARARAVKEAHHSRIGIENGYVVDVINGQTAEEEAGSFKYNHVRNVSGIQFRSYEPPLIFPSYVLASKNRADWLLHLCCVGSDMGQRDRA